MARRIPTEKVQQLIKGLEEYGRGTDPWVLSDGSFIEPLDVLQDLVDAREIIDDLARGAEFERRAREEDL
jgi:hypothetical protein